MRPLRSAETFRAALAVFAWLALCARGAASDQVPERAELGWRAWYTDDGLSYGLVWGPEARVLLSRHAWLRGGYRHGEYRQPGDLELLDEWEGVVGVSLRYADIFTGYRHTAFETRLSPGWKWGWMWEELERNGDVGGLLFGVRSSARIAGPLGLGGGLSVMPEDSGILTQIGYDAAHADADAALQYTWRRATLSAGFALRRYKAMPRRNVRNEWSDRRVLSGPFLAVAATL